MTREFARLGVTLFQSRGRVPIGPTASPQRVCPMAEDENEFIRAHGFAEYSKWHLGIDETHAEATKARYKFPFGDFKNVHRCGLLAVKSRAHQFGYADIEKAATQLIEIINSKKENRLGAKHRLPVSAPSGVTLR